MENCMILANICRLASRTVVWCCWNDCDIFGRQQRARNAFSKSRSNTNLGSRKGTTSNSRYYPKHSADPCWVMQCVYASTILYLLTLSLAKVSTLITIARLTGHKISLAKVRFTGAVVLLWSVASIFAVAFQCGLPRPWNYLGGRCFDPVSHVFAIQNSLLIRT